MTTQEAPILDDDTGSSGPPAVVLTAPGESVVVGLVDVNKTQLNDFNTGEPATFPNGDPKKTTIVTGLVVFCTDGAAKGNTTESEPLEAGDVVSFFMDGARWFAWKDALATLGRPARVGDVMRFDRGDDRPPKQKGWKPGHSYTAVLRGTEARDGNLSDRCIDAYNAKKAEAAPDLDGGNGPVYGDEEPF